MLWYYLHIAFSVILILTVLYYFCQFLTKIHCTISIHFCISAHCPTAMSMSIAHVECPTLGTSAERECVGLKWYLNCSTTYQRSIIDKRVTGYFNKHRRHSSYEIYTVFIRSTLVSFIRIHFGWKPLTFMTLLCYRLLSRVCWSWNSYWTILYRRYITVETTFSVVTM